MTQTQLINLVPNLQAGPVQAAKNNGYKDAKTDFHDMLNPGSVKLNRQPGYADGRAEATKGQTAQGQAPQDQTADKAGPSSAKPWHKQKLGVRPEQTVAQQPEQAQEQDPTTQYILSLVTPPAEAAQNLTKNDTALQLVDTIVSILEGSQSNILIDKEIVPLLTQLQQTLQQTEQPLPAEFAALLEEMARTPQAEDLTETPQKLAKLSQFLETLRGYLCPPENANENQVRQPAQTVEFTPVITPAAQSAEPQGGNDADLQEGFRQDQAKTADSKALPENASFQIDPVRLAFSDKLSAAAAPVAQPLTAENLFSAMVERIVSLPESQPHMEISLKPDHLGKLTIDLVMGDNGLTAKIMASDEGVRNLLAAHVNRLSDTLAEKGIRVENVEVIYTALDDKAFGRQQQGGQEARDGNLRQNAKLGSAEAVTATPWENAYDQPLYGDGLDWGLSSVEYRA